MVRKLQSEEEKNFNRSKVARNFIRIVIKGTNIYY